MKTSSDRAQVLREQRRNIFLLKSDIPLDDAFLRSLREYTSSAINEEAVARAIESGLGWRPAHVTPLSTQGTFHRLFQISDASSKRQFIMRTNALHAQWCDDGMLLDAWCEGLLRAQGLPVLHVEAVDVTRAVVPFEWELLEPARGQVLSVFDQDDTLMAEPLAQLGRCLAQIHSIHTEGYGLFEPSSLASPDGRVQGAHETWWDYLTCNLETHVRDCCAIEAIDAPEARLIETLFERSRRWLGEISPVLLHGDLGNHNVFVDGGSVTALIDWEDCLSGDPVFDLASWATFHPERRHAAFIAAYASRRALPPDFKLRFWLYFLRMALAKTVHRSRFAVPDRPDRPKASRRIQLALERLEAVAGGLS